MAGNTSNISGTQGKSVYIASQTNTHKGAYNEYMSDRNKTMCTS